MRADVQAVRDKAPFIYGLTNFVAAGLSANALLALGAGPAFGAAPGWTGAFPAGAGAMFINGASLMSVGHARRTCSRPRATRGGGRHPVGARPGGRGRRRPGVRRR